MRRSVGILAVVLVAVALAEVFTPMPSFADEVRGDQGYLETPSVDIAHELPLGEGATVGLVDTGEGVAHPELKIIVNVDNNFGGASGDGLKYDNMNNALDRKYCGCHGNGDGLSKRILRFGPEVTIVSIATPPKLGISIY